MDEDELHRDQVIYPQLHAWLQQMRHFGPTGIEGLASKYRNGARCSSQDQARGSFNFCFKVVFDDGIAWAVRFPMPGKVVYPFEKIQREAAVMSFVREKTQIPIPAVVAYGPATAAHGAFIITEWIDGVSLQSLMERQPRSELGPKLSDDLSEETLCKIYREMAKIILELSRHEFPRIGALSPSLDDNGIASWTVASRPMTLKMNEIESSGAVQVEDLSLQPFCSVSAYAQHLIQQSIDHLHLQQNSVDDEEDARRKFVLRAQMKGAVPYFTHPAFESGPFKLVCDDLRPGNVLVNPDTFDIVAVIDWEWAYAGPYQFLFSPPRWLILRNPAGWTHRDQEQYAEKLNVFLQALELEEVCMQHDGFRGDGPAMSRLMRESMASGKFWFNEKLVESFNFDEDVLWPNIKALLKSWGHWETLCADHPPPADMEERIGTKLKALKMYQENLERLKSICTEAGLPN